MSDIKPEPGTYWIDRSGHLWFWQCQRLESEPGVLTLVMVRLGPVHESERVEQTSPKEQTDG